MMRPSTPPKLLITDLDNTLYDWVTFFARSFQAMSRVLAGLIGVDEEQLLAEFKAVHRRYGNSEQPFAALELPSVQARFGTMSRRELLQQLRPAFDAFDAMRLRELRLYDGVEQTLRVLEERGVAIVGHTEAIAVNAWNRLSRLGIARHFRRLYTLEGHVEPHPVPGYVTAHRPPPDVIVSVPKAERKPNPALLREICAREGVTPRDAWFVGDSTTRDMSMAKEAGVMALWARYGTRYDRELWRILVKVTHWSDEDVAREEALKRRYGELSGDYNLDRFDEILELAGLDDAAASIGPAEEQPRV